MKKAFAAFAALFLFITILVGCVSGDGNEAAVSPSNETNLAVSYKEYTDVKVAAFDTIATELGYDSELYEEMTPRFITAGTADITVLPITAIGGTEEALSTLESLGFIGVKVRQEGEEYIITYKGPDGQDYTQSCRYDASLDSIQSTVTDSSGRETVLFEYIKTADGYTAQYFFGDTAEYPWVTVYVGADISAFGVSASGDRPDTLLLSATLGSDYVKKCETYFMLESDKLIIFDSGETITMVRKQH